MAQTYVTCDECGNVQAAGHENPPFTVQLCKKCGKRVRGLPDPTDARLFGINIVVDNEMPSDEIQLRYGPRVVARITNAAFTDRDGVTFAPFE